MAKSKKKSKVKGDKKSNETSNKQSRKEEERQKSKNQKRIITMEALDAISSSDDDDGDDQVLPPEHQWNKMAKNLRKAIEDGEFEKLVNNSDDEEDDDGDEFEEVIMESDSEEEDDDDDDDDDDDKVDSKGKEEENANESGSDDDEDEEEDGDSSSSEEDEPAKKKSKVDKSKPQEDNDDDDDDEEEEAQQQEKQSMPPKEKTIKEKNTLSSKALEMVTAELEAVTSTMPWSETFEIIPKTPLPFGTSSRGGGGGNDQGDGDEEDDNSPIDIHDDLKREAAFYNTALDAVMEARTKCRDVGIPFSRPDDFFAEMVKTDDHMAKIKDRLIFENKKIEAVAQRKANREQKLRSKESHANKLAEKAKRKKDHLRQVEEWAKSAASNRGGARDDGEDDAYLARMGGGRVSKKRQAADRKYGYGGKRGRFKQMDRKTLNDTSSFNPRGNFGGIGTKKTSAGKKSFSGAGAKRHGKRARDASRARRS